jgi:hypothetical protein
MTANHLSFFREASVHRVLRVLLSLLIACSVVAPALAQGAPPQGGADKPYTIEYYYKVQWGHQQEFHDLFPQESLSASEEDPDYRADAGRQD